MVNLLVWPLPLYFNPLLGMAYSYLSPVNPIYKNNQDPSLKPLCYTVV